MNGLLSAYLERKKRSHPGYSLRAVARDLNVSPAFVSGIFSGKRKLPYRLVDRLAKVLEMDASDVLEIKRSFAPENVMFVAPSPKSKAAWKLAEKREFSILRQWFYLAILELTNCNGAPVTEELIARRLRLSTQSVEVAVRELIGIGALLKQADGTLRKSTRYLRIPTANSKSEVRNFHAQMLTKAKDCLSHQNSEQDFDRRLIMGIVVTANRERIQIARKMLSDRLYEIAEFLAEGEGTDVYHLAGQLFPLTEK